MIGKELIMYILENNYVHSDIEYILNNLLLTDELYAVKNKTGVFTVKALIELQKLPGVKIGESFYILNTTRGADEKNI